MQRPARVLVGVAALAVIVGACGAIGNGSDGDAPEADTKEQPPPVYEQDVPPGGERLEFEYGPIAIQPGQNPIEFSGLDVPKPDFDGYITRIAADIRREDGTVPPVDVIHLHHGVWINLSGPSRGAPQPQFFASGEEKTVVNIPDGYGYEYRADDVWVINHMLHNLYPLTEDIWITYQLDIIPMDAPEAADIVPVQPLWMDVQNGSIYPVFDVIKGSGTDGVFTYPDDAPDAYAEDGWLRNEWYVDRETTIVATGGHLHPGGLHTDLWVERDPRTYEPVVGPESEPAPENVEQAHVFSSEAWYYEPAGAVSWDVAMTTTPTDWRVSLKPGDKLTISVSYDSARASWYESMGIMVAWLAEGVDGVDPFAEDVAVDGVLTHGHLPENDNHGGEQADLPDASELDARPLDGPIDIVDFVYEAGDTSEEAEWIPSVRQGESLTFNNVDAPVAAGIWHTITACKAPCNQSTGIAYPVADSDVEFDSGQLGVGGPPTSGSVTWETPADLEPGTYTYFCRVHPFMRGAFEVQPAR